MADLVMWLGILGIVVGLPWLLLHYVTKWKLASRMTGEDEKVLDDMYNLARRLEDRMATVERIVSLDNPDWKPGLHAPETHYPIDRRN